MVLYSTNFTLYTVLLILQIASLYADLRAQSVASGGVPIAVRHIESIIRMSEATARMHLRDHVRPDDVDFAIKVIICLFHWTILPYY